MSSKTQARSQFEVFLALSARLSPAAKDKFFLG